MRIFDIDSPLMQVLNKISDLMFLTILAFFCCVPVVTIGASLTALHYMALKIVRDEETYIIKGFFKSFKDNFRQATIIWLIILVLAAVFVVDIALVWNMEGKFYDVLIGVFTVLSFLLLFETAFVFPILAKFDNTIKKTMKNALVISIIQFPKTIVMIAMPVAMVALVIFFPVLVPIVFLFGMGTCAFVAAKMYNKFFAQMEDRIRAAMGPAPEEDHSEAIFTDETRLPQKNEQ